MSSDGKRRRRGADTARLDEASGIGSYGEGAAHDLAIYMDAISATLALATRQPADEQLRRDASRAIDQARRLATALADHVRGKYGEKTWVDLAEIVRATVKLAERGVASPIAVSLIIDEDVGLVHGIACELEQMVLNLVLTVRAWIPDDGALEIRVERVRGAAVIELSSTGDRRRTTSPARSVKSGSLGTVRRVLQRHCARMATSGNELLRVVIPAP